MNEVVKKLIRLADFYKEGYKGMQNAHLLLEEAREHQFGMGLDFYVPILGDILWNYQTIQSPYILALMQECLEGLQTRRATLPEITFWLSQVGHPQPLEEARHIVDMMHRFYYNRKNDVKKGYY